MDKLLARTMVEALSKGIDPLTGRILPRSDICANEEIQDALWEVLDSCTIESSQQILARIKEEKKAQAKETRNLNKQIYRNQGNPWGRMERQRLLELNQNYNICYTAKVLGRSPGAIDSELRKLGAVPNKKRYKR